MQVIVNLNKILFAKGECNLLFSGLAQTKIMNISYDIVFEHK